MSQHKRIDAMNLPALRRWRSENNPSLDAWDFLREAGGLQMCLAFSHLFWPSFVLIKGCVLLERRYEPKNFEKWWQELKGDRKRIESVINHVHLYVLFPADPEMGDTDEPFVELGEILAACWSCALSKAFPERKFDVSVTNDEEDYGPTIHFMQVDALHD